MTTTSLHLVAVQVSIHPKGSFFTGYLVPEADVLYALDGEAVTGNLQQRINTLAAAYRNVTEEDDPPKLARYVLEKEVASFKFRITGVMMPWLDWGELEMLSREIGMEDMFDCDIPKLSKVAHELMQHEEFAKFGGVIGFITLYELNTYTHYTEYGNDADYEWFYMGVIDDLTKLRSIVRQAPGDPCAPCHATGYVQRRPEDVFDIPMERPKCPVCAGTGTIQEQATHE